MSNSLIKANYVQVKGKDEKRVIDSNRAVLDRITLLNEILESSGIDESEFVEGFTEGLDAEQVDVLLQDQDEYADDAGTMIGAEDMERMLEEANAQAEAIINEANERAQAIINGADAEANDIKQRAYEEGHAEGEKAGYDDGMAKIASLEEELNQKEQQLVRDYEDQLSQLEPRFVETLTDIYSHIFHVDLSDKSELILYLLKDAIRGIDGSKNFFVHVSKEDYEFVTENRTQLEAGLASSCVVEVIEDMTLQQGEGFIEAESGIFDCGIDTELTLLKKELMLLSF